MVTLSAVIFLHRVELEASRRRQHAENDVGANAVIAAVAGRHRGCGCSRIVNVSIPLSARDGSADSPPSIAANDRCCRIATDRMMKSRYLIYFDNYPLTMVSLYGFQRKEGAGTKIRGNKPRRGAGSFQGGIDEAVCSSVRGGDRRCRFWSAPRPRKRSGRSGGGTSTTPIIPSALACRNSPKSCSPRAAAS